MNTNLNLRRKPSAFTLIEVFVVWAVITVLAGMTLFQGMSRKASARRRTRMLDCFRNLREIGTAYRLWANDHGDLNPYEQTIANGGWKELLTNTGAGSMCWTNYAIMMNDFGQAPRTLICPFDERLAVESFTNHFGNLNVSYFVGVSGTKDDPQAIRGGDRNLGPGSDPAADYGYSPADGRGNDVAVPIFGTNAWSRQMHSPAGAGAILLGDGSMQPCSSSSFTVNWLHKTTPGTNWPAGHVPLAPSIRLVFP